MRIVFMGTPEFAVPSLRALIDHGYDVAGVFTQPDRPRGRGKKLQPSPIKQAAEAAGIPVFQPEKIRRDGVDALRILHPDLCVTAAFGQILSQEILDIPPLGNINVHASLLPRHRGAAPIAHAIMDGDEETGVTTMFMDAGIDTGDILLQRATAIGPVETTEELTLRLSEIGATLLLETLEALQANTLRAVPQNEAEMTYDPMLTREMGLADFSGDARCVRGRINGLNPWPCFSVPMDSGRLRLLRADVAEGEGLAGQILAADARSGLMIGCGSGAVRILELQAPGGKAMRSEDYLRGHQLPVGRIWSEVQA